jgi:hypothetical protein
MRGKEEGGRVGVDLFCQLLNVHLLHRGNDLHHLKRGANNSTENTTSVDHWIRIRNRHQVRRFGHKNLYNFCYVPKLKVVHTIHTVISTNFVNL